MFTGIVEEVGTVADLRPGGPGAALDVACATVTTDADLGDSISVNGCCLTVTALSDTGFTTELMGETLGRTSLGALRPGDQVNLERALRVDDRLGGHLVQGHVDGVGTVEALTDRGAWAVMTVTLPEPLRRYVVDKGSITVEGTSLTVMEVHDSAFSVGLIPHTMAATTLGRRVPGDPVNLEVDVVAKYVERMLRGEGTSPYSP